MLIRISHGHTVGGPSPTYRVWNNMKSRCYNPKHPQYKDWGGRGIRVCERWQIFDNFLDDMGEKPPHLSLDRIDNDGDYGPDNCRWTTRSVQNRNKRQGSVPWTHCKRGHKFTFETSEFRPNGTKRCRICTNDRRRKANRLRRLLAQGVTK